MGASVWIAAQRKVTDDDREHISIYNQCRKRGITPPVQVTEHLHKVLGDYIMEKAQDNECIAIEEDTVEVNLYGRWEGDPDYGDGAILMLSDLPPETIAIRVYMS